MRNPHHMSHAWAMWRGIVLALAFLSAATLGFTLGHRSRGEWARGSSTMSRLV
jgi:hypothetical protein